MSSTKKNIGTEQKIIFELSDENITIDIFENILYNLQKNSTYKNRKNFSVIYEDNNKYLKIFQDGSCFCFKILKQNKEKLSNDKNDFIPYNVQTTTQLLKNDDFPNKIKYDNISKNYQIIFTLPNNNELIFEKIISNKIEYKIYAKIKENKEIDKILDCLSLVKKD